MNRFRKTRLLWKEIGYRELFAYAKYRSRLSLGFIKKATPPYGWPDIKIPDSSALISGFSFLDWSLFDSEISPAITPFTDTLKMYQEGEFLEFWGEPRPINLRPPTPQLDHWTVYQNDLNGQDIKHAWEPARFSWSLDLARLYAVTGDESLAEIFWDKVLEFIQHNPPNLGPNWSSAQEVALRAISWLLALGSFQVSEKSTQDRINHLLHSTWQHAKRICTTLEYAESQKNNHILSESLALILVGDLFSPISDEASRWVEMGTSKFEKGLLEQIDPVGNYSQHSSAYHRMMLHLALLYHAWLGEKGVALTGEVLGKLKLATTWLIVQLDPVSGRLPNLGHNDGTLLLPFGFEDYNDFRPIAQAASLAFLGAPCLPSGKWDELAYWLRLSTHGSIIDPQHLVSIAIRKVGDASTWGTLRAVQYNGRPAHADQLHVDLWWMGENIATDAGTYSYNSPPPWQNALDSTRVHNTVTIDEQDQMERVSRFLWLDQANAEWLDSTEENTITASHDGYRKLGIVHQRYLTYLPADRFRVIDELSAGIREQALHAVTIHWLLPDWEFHLENEKLILSKGTKRFSVEVKATQKTTLTLLKALEVSIIRAGVTVSGNRQDPNLGWKSETYFKLTPAVSFSCTFKSAMPIQIITDWILLNDSSSKN